MNEAEETAHPLKFEDKARLVVACAVATGLFTSVGWMVIRPSDPQAAVTVLIDGRTGVAVWLPTLGLTAVVAALAAAIAGPALRDAGTFAAAIGMAMVALRGGSMTQLLMYHGVTESNRRALAIRLMLDAMLWFAAIMAAWLVDAIVRRWLDERVVRTAEAPASQSRCRGRVRDAFVHVRDGVFGMLTCAVVAAGVASLVIARSPESWIEPGQVYFALCLGFFCGAGVGNYLWRKGACCWYMLSTLLVALFAYGHGYLSPRLQEPYYGELATAPPNDLFRGLPIEYVAVGTVGVLLGCWLIQRMYPTAPTEV